MKSIKTIAIAAMLVLALPLFAQVDLSKVKLNGYLQAQYVDDESSSDAVGAKHDSFSVRRARLKLTYQATKAARLTIQPDFGSSGVTIKDAYAELTEPWTAWKNTLTVGQFGAPFGFELGYSSSRREVPERSRYVRALFPERDRGVMLSGRSPNQKFTYNVALINGSGIGHSEDQNEGKDLVGRIGYTVGDLAVGASIYHGTDLVATAGRPAGAEFDKERQGLDVQWKTPLPGLTLRGEYVIGKHAPAPGTARSESFDVAGWNAYVLQTIGKHHQVAARIDEYDRDTDTPGSAIRTVTGSYVFHWDEHNKVMAAYEMPDTDADDDVFTLRYQFSF